MRVRYPLPDGREDTHHALVIMAVNPDTGRLEARSYTDGGSLLDFDLEMNDGALLFEDRVPTHEIEITRARKSVVPTQEGFEERLEIDRGAGTLEPYYTIRMERMID